MTMPMSSKTFQTPSLSVEQSLFDSGARFVIGIDEVGRGSIAGPVAVGVALIDSKNLKHEGVWPAGLRDSKLLSEKTRERMQPEVASWVAGFAVGFASVDEIETLGIVACLALAANRALGELLESQSIRSQVALDGAHILLDGSHNWLGAKAWGIPVSVRTKADRDCVSVACASVLAKVARDEQLIDLAKAHPRFGFEGNKGYASPGHIAALRELGPTAAHRVSWLAKILAVETGVQTGLVD